jgi:Ca2+-binding EF-hand superfamily protein
MRNKTVEFAGKKIRVEEKRIGELEKIVAELFPESKGNIQKVDLSKLLEQAGFDLLYEKLPIIIPDITKDDVKNSYMSELEALVEAFVDVNFTGIKRLVGPLMNLIQAGTQPGLPRK